MNLSWGSVDRKINDISVDEYLRGTGQSTGPNSAAAVADVGSVYSADGAGLDAPAYTNLSDAIGV